MKNMPFYLPYWSHLKAPTMLKPFIIPMKEDGLVVGWAEISSFFMLIQRYMGPAAKSVPTSINGAHKKHFRNLESGFFKFS